MNHIVLLGDSIFDNVRYVPDGPPVIEQLRAVLEKDWSATLLAIDGDIAADVSAQLHRLPVDASHLVVSVGGNDALQNADLISNTSDSAARGFEELAVIQQRFRRDYREMLDAVLALRRKTAVCTIYDAVPGLSPSAVTALSIFNDIILQEAIRRGVPVLDLRFVCTEAADYSAVSPIEPSEIGGAKIVYGIVQIVVRHDFSKEETVVYKS